MALLTAQILGDDIVGVDLPIPPKQYVPTPFKIEDTPSPAFADISSVLNWEKYGLRKDLKRDYGFVREQIKEIIKAKGVATTITILEDPTTISKVEGDRYLVGDNPTGELANQSGAIAIVKSDLSFEFKDKDEIGYHELTVPEKEIAVKYNIGNLDDHENDPQLNLTISEIQSLNAEYHRDATANRYYRRQWVETIVYRDLPDTKSIVVLDTRFSPVGDLIINYSDNGIKGTVEDWTVQNQNPTPGLCDYLYSRSIFAAGGNHAGLSSKGWNTRTGRPLLDLIDEMYDCLVHGIYR